MKNKNYRNLIMELAFTDFKLKYQGSILGYLWSLVKPVALFLVLYTVFAKFLKIGSSIPNYPAYLLLGVVFWSFFAEITSSSLDSIVSRGELIRKVYFPRSALVISRGLTSLMTFSINLGVVFLFLLVLNIKINPQALLVFLLTVELFLLNIGVGLYLSSLFVKYRDVAHIWEVFLQIFFYATPILYPLSLVPEKIRKILMLSPVAQIIQDTRYFLVTKETQTSYSILGAKLFWIPYVLTVVIFLLGLRKFNRSAAKFAEEV